MIIKFSIFEPNEKEADFKLNRGLKKLNDLRISTQK